MTSPLPSPPIPYKAPSFRRILRPNFAAMGEEEPEIVRLLQDVPPAHFMLKIDGFSAFWEILGEKKTTNYESEQFQADGYKWKLVLGLNDDKDKDKYISLHVAIVDLPKGCASAMLRLFIYNYAKKKYLTVQDGRARRYDTSMMMHGFDKLFSLSEFLDHTSGYLVDGCCAFGAEVHVMESAISNVHSSIVAKNLIWRLEGGVHRWIIDNFSTLEGRCSSTSFTGGPCNWKIILYPKGNGIGSGNSISAFLERLDDSKVKKVTAKFKIVVEHQNGGDHHTLSGCQCFHDDEEWGFPKFLSLKELTQGYLKEDRLIIEASIEAFFFLTLLRYT